MAKKIPICVCTVAVFLVHLVAARHTFSSKFIGEDSVVIVDANRVPAMIASNINHPSQHHKGRYHFRPLRYPAYQIISPLDKENVKPLDTAFSTTTTTTSPTITIFTKEEFPRDLLEIAQNKLGITKLDEIPSIGELGELLGTETAEETIKYIRDLTATEEGIEFVKAYIESTDYTDMTRAETAVEAQATSSEGVKKSAGDNEAKNLSTQSVDEFPTFFERLAGYFNIFGLFHSKHISEDVEVKPLQLRNHSTTKQEKRTDHRKVAAEQRAIPVQNQNNQMKKTHKSVRKQNIVPFQYPIPIRPVILYRPRISPPFGASSQLVVHLNTPKMFLTQQQRARTNGKPPQLLAKHEMQVDRLEQPDTKQKQLSELADRVSKFPLTKDRSALVDDQVVDAVKTVFAKDEDFKNILDSAETLK